MKINLIEYFENTIKKYADKVAVWDKERYATFAELGKYFKIMKYLRSQ